MIKLLIIGKNSYVSKNLINFIKNKINYEVVSHDRLNTTKFINYSHIVNFSISPKSLKKNLKDSENIDLKIARQIKNKNIFYIFMNTRKIYKIGENLKENSKIQLKNYYEINKYKTEKKLSKILKSKLLSLRVSNILGKPFRSSKQVHKTFIFNYLDLLKSDNKKIQVDNDFKDFISAEQFSKIFLELITKNISGILNVSIGRKIYVRTLLKWIDKKYYKNFNFKYSSKNSFFLNNNNLKSKISYKILLKDLKSFVKKTNYAKTKKSK